MNRAVWVAAAALALVGCKDKGQDTSEVVWECQLAADPVPNWGEQVGCWDDFEMLASDPLDASIPGAQSTKTVIDRIDGDKLYFTNSELYPIHYDFASEFLSGDGLPIITDLGSFNAVEYYSPDRRFILGAVTFYEEPGVYVYEIAPYDTASAEMITQAYRAIAENAYFGDELLFHPTSQAIEALSADLPEDVKIITTDELFAGITYQPLNLGVSMGLLQFYEAAAVEEYVNFREIVVLDEIPNDIAIVSGTITAEFQTPLAHINVLAQNRGTPNMALRGAYENEELRALEGKWVELSVQGLEWSIREVTEAEADAWWEDHRPEPLEVTPMDLSVQGGMWACDDIVNLEQPLGDAISERVPAFGGKATNMSVLARIGPEVPTPPCYGIPVYYYNQHMETHGLWAMYNEMTQTEEWADPNLRRELLKDLRDAIKDAPIDRDFVMSVVDRIDAERDRTKMRFRSSTNAEDLGNFTGAGLYTSNSGEWDPTGYDIEDAIKKVWASVWNARAWEERQYWGIEHTNVGMAMLVNPTFDDELANGVAITGNVYDTAGLEPAFYINAQRGENSVVIPEDGDTTDQVLYYFNLPGQPVVYIAHSNLVPDGETVLSNAELYELGVALNAVHNFFYEAYGTQGGFYAMDTEFKIDSNGELKLKQARPYPGWNQGN